MDYLISNESLRQDKVNEALVAYYKSAGLKNFNGFSSNGFFSNKMLIVKAIREGMPYKIFNLIKKVTPFSDEDWANYLNLSSKSLQRYKNDENFIFKPIHTEKILEITEVTKMGISVFDSSSQFYAWLNTPTLGLGNNTPASLLQDSYGKELVTAELNRIEYGIFA